MVLAQGPVAMAASWVTAVEYAVENQLSGRGELKLCLIQLLAVLPQLSAREQAVLVVLLVVSTGISVVRVYMKRVYHSVEESGWRTKIKFGT